MSSLMTSANGCSSPSGPTRFGPDASLHAGRLSCVRNRSKTRRIRMTAISNEQDLRGRDHVTVAAASGGASRVPERHSAGTSSSQVIRPLRSSLSPYRRCALRASVATRSRTPHQALSTRIHRHVSSSATRRRLIRLTDSVLHRLSKRCRWPRRPAAHAPHRATSSLVS